MKARYNFLSKKLCKEWVRAETYILSQRANKLIPLLSSKVLLRYLQTSLLETLKSQIGLSLTWPLSALDRVFPKCWL